MPILPPPSRITLAETLSELVKPNTMMKRNWRWSGSPLSATLRC